MANASLQASASQDAFTRTRRLATGFLAAMAGTFLLTYLAPDPRWPVLLLRSVAEAGMIGGLADWFAVTALFRHPLGLPIPHTALLPKNQAKAARNVGRFFETHFLQPTQVRERILAIEPSRHFADWLADRANARALAAQLVDVLGALLREDLPTRVQVRVRAWLRSLATSAGSDAAIAAGVAALVKQGVRADMVGEVLALVRRAVDENRDTAVALVQDRSRWWIASTVDRRVASLVVEGVLSLLDDLCKEGSDLRRGFEASFDRMVDALEAEGGLEHAVADARRHLIRSGALDDMVIQLAAALRERLRDRLADPSALADPVADLIRDVALRALADPAARAGFDARAADLAAQAVGDLRPAIAGYVTDVIAGWEPEELNARFEAELGPDLQFIRINGAVLGALIGGALFGFEALFG